MKDGEVSYVKKFKAMDWILIVISVASLTGCILNSKGGIS